MPHLRQHQAEAGTNEPNLGHVHLSFYFSLNVAGADKAQAGTYCREEARRACPARLSPERQRVVDGLHCELCDRKQHGHDPLAAEVYERRPSGEC